MRDWKFRINEFAVINEKAVGYLPCHIGSLVEIFELKTKGINDYTVKLENGDYVFVKEEELNKVDSEVAKIYWDVINGKYKAKYIPTNETVTILVFDLLHNQAEISYGDGSMEVVNASKLKRIVSEVDSVIKVAKYKIGDTVIIQTNDIDYHNQVGVIEKVKAYSESFEYGLKVDGREYLLWFNETVLALYNHENEGAVMVEKEIGKFEKIATELGQFTDKKNKQYGSSVDATYEMIKVLMDRYKNKDDTYTIPQSLLRHILLQVRMMDKTNRVFNNPSGEGDSESPYKDLVGYSLIGVEMVERNSN